MNLLNHEHESILTAEDRWQAVLERDARYDGVFYYAVHSTGIFCRPSCPSRRPDASQVTFFDTPDAASQAGFRPCKRCRPGEVDAHMRMVEQVCAFIDSQLDDAPTLEQIGAEVNLSPFHVQRIFKRIMGISPRQYADSRRLERFKLHLKDGQPVTRAVYDAGYNSVSQVYPTRLGMAPVDYKRGGVGAQVRYVIAPCSLGYVLVASTARGVCAVSLGDSPEALQAALELEYPGAQIAAEDVETQQGLQIILAYLDGQQTPLHLLPLDIRATAFQQRVWEALRSIPYGETRSYSDVAESIGAPKAVRAVAQACAHNPAALVIPCHRVVRQDGSLGGYRWDIDRKRALLAQEAQTAPERAITE